MRDKEYNEYNDYELVALAQEKNEEAINIIYKKYRPIIIKKSKHAIIFASHHGIEISDIMQEAFIGLDEAINNFTENSNASFYTFATICIDRKIYNYLRWLNQEKENVLNEAINIDENLEKNFKDDMDIEHIVLSAEYDNFLYDRIISLLTDYERNVFELKIKGFPADEIAKKLNRSNKAIHNTLRRIREKIKKYIKDN